jgi:DNA-directed RNA polymerase specialized sigma subunit
MVKKEFPFDPLDLSWKAQGNQKQKQTEIEILQEPEPHAALEESQEERIQLQEAVLDAFDELDDEEIWLLNALLFERLSLRQVERLTQLPKTTVARKRDYILRKLKRALNKHQIVRDHLTFLLIYFIV